MKYRTNGLTRSEYERMLSESLSEKILNVIVAKEMFSDLNIQDRYIIEAFNKKTFGRLVRKFRPALFEQNYQIWYKKLYKIMKEKEETGIRIRIIDRENAIYLGEPVLFEFSNQSSDEKMKYNLQPHSQIKIDGEAITQRERRLLEEGATIGVHGVWFNFTKNKSNPEMTLCLTKIIL